MLDLGEYQSLDANNFQFAVYLSPVQTPQPSNNGYSMFVQFGVTVIPSWQIANFCNGGKVLSRSFRKIYTLKNFGHWKTLKKIVWIKKSYLALKGFFQTNW